MPVEKYQNSYQTEKAGDPEHPSSQTIKNRRTTI